VYSVDNIVGETHATDMLTTFEVKVDATENRQSQLVVYVSEGTVIRNVDIQYEHCNSTSESSRDVLLCILSILYVESSIGCLCYVLC